MDALTLQHICHVSIISKFCVSAYEIQWKNRQHKLYLIRSVWSVRLWVSNFRKAFGSLLEWMDWEPQRFFKCSDTKNSEIFHKQVMLDRFSFTLSCKGDGSHSDNIHDNNCFTLAESTNKQSYLKSCEAHQEASNSVTCVSCRRWSCTSPASRRSWVWRSATGRMMRRILAFMLGR